MIVIEGINYITFGEGTLSELELAIFQKKQASPYEYRYDSIHDLLFELHMRTQIMESAKELSGAGVYFAGFQKTLCNPIYWHLTNEGRFQLNHGVKPRDAIRDIFENGGSYGFECSMAVIVVMYHALLHSIDPGQFDRLFAGLLLFDWHSNGKLNLIDRFDKEEAVVGDVLYFENPDVEELLPWWKGENVVLLENELYYGHGHGLGIASGEEVINVLNKYRMPGSTKSAFLTDRYVHPDFSYFSEFQHPLREKPLITKIGDWIHVRKAGFFTTLGK
ncbi:protein-glutamine gamma-glutamyltransferase [Paenibacillus chondroitinus]|uniref:Protein-glutamine gamma-glutamyltransferase n=1 Tax=Paenibacillus chondroitinus TaxID=59842 RepID=A0ABU6DJL6_9BACL|nr:MULTISPECIES: protein-glutamine gamma-glutamyltransferase [Paenibacillus]MCY9660974.1 protein-glutamine gamma-glutamyltransferase [Paenibacillus anseongense]MEB4797967.1 protein-glutamine gamma-glutamyltransferase [Paenibacillus chondroitinus]